MQNTHTPTTNAHLILPVPLPLLHTALCQCWLLLCPRPCLLSPAAAGISLALVWPPGEVEDERKLV